MILKYLKIYEERDRSNNNTNDIANSKFYFIISQTNRVFEKTTLNG